MQTAKQKQRSILITGCSSGIGLCTAIGLQQRGYRIFATARREEDVAQLQDRGLEALQLDLTDDASIQRALDEVLKRTNGRLDALFNNGAYGQPGAVEDLRREVLLEQFETNFFGTHELTRLVLTVMRRQRYGRIIQNSSLLGFVSLPFRGAYNSSKYALEGISDTLRLELRGTGIYVSLIEPGPITSRFRANAAEKYRQNIEREQSPFRELYATLEQRLDDEEQEAPFTLPPEAVLRRVIHALESKRPRARYYVTFPTYLLATLKRLLSHRAMDYVLSSIARSESRRR